MRTLSSTPHPPYEGARETHSERDRAEADEGTSATGEGLNIDRERARHTH